MTTFTTSSRKFSEYKHLNLPEIDKEIIRFWEENQVFEESLKRRKDAPSFVFYEGPPSANGMPGIHHVMARTIKDLFCRYKTQKGFRVERKGGWDTHGLPIELAVEKSLGIKKEDIGSRISVEEYNQTCRKEVMKYKDVWDQITHKMGYWIDLDNPYITFENDYIETLWWALKELYNKGLLYKGYTIQPFSPAAGTGLSSHELNQPGAYRPVKDTTVVAQFRLLEDQKHPHGNLFDSLEHKEVFFLAWTTTPWTLPSNTALAVGPEIRYCLIETYNPYTALPVTIILAEERINAWLNQENKTDLFTGFEPGQKSLPWRLAGTVSGRELCGLRYEQLLPYAQPETGDAFVVIPGDFVSTEDGTGIVHIAPSFGSDDMRVARQHGVGSLTLVDRKGRFVPQVTDFAGLPVKDYDDDPDYESVDVKIAVKLKKENRAFRVEKYEHNYPHCWRTDKPIIYYPLDSWFIKTTAYKERMVELNQTINWKPESTGTGRFGQWLQNLVDWNLSRSRYWGTPLPIWRTKDGTEELCIGSLTELREEVEKSVAAGWMTGPLPEDFELHKPYVDQVVLVSQTGQPMYREPDLIDVWFDSGAMPYAQWHFPFKNKDVFERNFPADFIAEGVDQTRGWFFTLHALAVMLFDSVAYKNVISNGLVLDKNGSKMSKRLGNVVDPFVTIDQHGADATRWYIISNSQPWDDLRFDPAGVEEVKRKFLGTLYNTYAFFALYANIDGFQYKEKEQAIESRPEIDRWILSLLNSLIKDVDSAYQDYEPTKAARAIQYFVTEQLSNWYVRLCRRRFWKGDYSDDKISAYQTLYRCLEVVASLMAPIAPFFGEFLYRNLNRATGRNQEISVHTALFPQTDGRLIDLALEERMMLAQDLSSMTLSLRKNAKIKVRQPLRKILIPVLKPELKNQIEKVEDLIKTEVNVKLIEFISNTDDLLIKQVKPDFKKLGPKLGKQMKSAAAAISSLSKEAIRTLEQSGEITLQLEEGNFLLNREDVEIVTEDLPGWLVITENNLTVALDIEISDDLLHEGNARELVNKIQRLRKDSGFNVTDRILLVVEDEPEVSAAILHHKAYICSEILAAEVLIQQSLPQGQLIEVNEKQVRVEISLK